MFRRPLRRDVVRRRLYLMWIDGDFDWWANRVDVRDPPEKSRARPQLAEDERIGGEARVEDPRQCLLPL